MQQVDWSLRTIQKATRFIGPSAAWTGAWIFLLCGRWDRAEALLTDARKRRLNNPALLALLALCQARRGKLQSAILSSKLACNPHPPNKEYAKQLISLLLDGGLLREAAEQLQNVDSELRSDAELMFSMVRFKLMSRKLSEAEDWERLYRQQSGGPHKFVR